MRKNVSYFLKHTLKSLKYKIPIIYYNVYSGKIHILKSTKWLREKNFIFNKHRASLAFMNDRLLLFWLLAPRFCHFLPESLKERRFFKSDLPRSQPFENPCRAKPKTLVPNSKYTWSYEFLEFLLGPRGAKNLGTACKNRP